jgi:hypothetical protein
MIQQGLPFGKMGKFSFSKERDGWTRLRVI